MSSRYYFWGRTGRGGRVAIARGSVSTSRKRTEEFGREHRLEAAGWSRYSVKPSDAPRAIVNACAGPELRTNAGQGARVSFHGAFKSKAAARRKEAEVPGSYILPRKIKGQQRYMVLQAENGIRRRSRAGSSRKNPPAKNPPATEIYAHLREIVATKGPEHFNCDPACRRAKHTYRHVFTSGPPVLGLEDGSLAIPATF